jgi:hypothetical protein
MKGLITEQQTWQTLTRVRALLVAGWTQEVHARDARGRQVPLDDPTACAFCLEGAVYRALEMGPPEVNSYPILRRLEDLVRAKTGDPDDCLADYNDRAPSVEKVLEVVDEAIWETERQLAALREK